MAVAHGVPLIIGDTGDHPLLARLVEECGIEAIINFVASIVVPDSVRDPVDYYRYSTVKSRAMIECAVIAA